jgi:hypothetical protein
LVIEGVTFAGNTMLLLQMYGLAETFQRGALVTDLVVELSQRSLVLDSDGRLPRLAALLGFPIRRDRLLELSLGNAARGK